AVGLGTVDLVARNLAVSLRLDVPPSHEEQPVDTREQLRRSGGLAGKEQHRPRTSATKRLDVVLRHPVPADQPPRDPSGCEVIGDDADPRIAHSDITRTITRTGPWTPSTGVISMSLVRDGPVTSTRDDGDLPPSPQISSSRSQSSSNPGTRRLPGKRTRCVGGSRAVVRCPCAEERSTEPVAATPRIADVIPRPALGSPTGSTGHPARASPSRTGEPSSPSSWTIAPSETRAISAMASGSSVRPTSLACPPTSARAFANRSKAGRGVGRRRGPRASPEAGVGGYGSGRGSRPSGGAPRPPRTRSPPSRRSRRIRRNSLRSTGSPPPLPERFLRERRQVATRGPPRQREGRAPEATRARERSLGQPRETHRRPVAGCRAPQSAPEREPESFGPARLLGGRIAAKRDQELVDRDPDRARVGAGRAERRGVGQVARALEAVHQRGEDRADRSSVDAAVRVPADLPEHRAHVLTGTAPDAVEHRAVLGRKQGRTAVVEDHDVELLGPVRLVAAARAVYHIDVGGDALPRRARSEERQEHGELAKGRDDPLHAHHRDVHAGERRGHPPVPLVRDDHERTGRGDAEVHAGDADVGPQESLAEDA